MIIRSLDLRFLPNIPDCQLSFLPSSRLGLYQVGKVVQPGRGKLHGAQTPQTCRLRTVKRQACARLGLSHIPQMRIFDLLVHIQE